MRARAQADPLAHAARLSDEVSGLFDVRTSRGLTQNQRAGRAWYACNGDLERRHTTGVFLRKGRSASAAPVMGVYVDNSACLADFSMRADIYLTRLATVGCHVSGIEFRLSRREYIGNRGQGRADAGRERAGQATEPSGHGAPLLQPLSAAERSEAAAISALVDQRVAPALRERVSRVVELSFERQKALGSQK